MLTRTIAAIPEAKSQLGAASEQRISAVARLEEMTETVVRLNESVAVLLQSAESAIRPSEYADLEARVKTIHAEFTGNPAIEGPDDCRLCRLVNQQDAAITAIGSAVLSIARALQL